MYGERDEVSTALIYDEPFSGSGTGYHETAPDEPTSYDPHPGRFTLDPEEDAMNLQVRQEVARLRREVPNLRQFGITPGLHWSGNADELTVDALPWKVTFFAGEGLYIGDGPTLAAAMGDAIGKYKSVTRAMNLDSVATSAERAVA